MSEDRAEARFAIIWAEGHRIQPEITKDWANNDWAKGRNQLMSQKTEANGKLMKRHELSDEEETTHED